MVSEWFFRSHKGQRCDGIDVGCDVDHDQPIGGGCLLDSPLQFRGSLHADADGAESLGDFREVNLAESPELETLFGRCRDRNTVRAVLDGEFPIHAPFR